jgi:hypothetical protein
MIELMPTDPSPALEPPLARFPCPVFPTSVKVGNGLLFRQRQDALLTCSRPLWQSTRFRQKTHGVS